MKAAYRVLAYLIAAGVVVQSMAMVFAVAGLGKWVEDGGVLDKAAMESDQAPFPEVVGFAVHGINGMVIMPIVAMLLLLVSFFARIPGGIAWAGLVLLLVVLQVVLGLVGHGLPILGALHGLNALLLLGVAVLAARRVGRVTVDRSLPPDGRVAATPA